MAKVAKSKPWAVFQAGDRVRVGNGAVGRLGFEGTVRRVFWAKASGGQPAGYVCDLGADASGMNVQILERLLERA